MTPRAAANDTRALPPLAAALMLLACALPWVLERPNRLAPGELHGLPALEIALSGLVAVAVPALGRWPLAQTLAANAALTLGFWWLGRNAGAALEGAAEIARASASSGFWVWTLGAGVALYAVGLNSGNTGQGGSGSRVNLNAWLRWLWLPAVALLFARGHLDVWSVVRELRVQESRFWQELLQHVRLVGSALGIATLIGVPLTVWASRSQRSTAASRSCRARRPARMTSLLVA